MRVLILVLALVCAMALLTLPLPVKSNLLNLQALSLGAAQAERAHVPFYGNFHVPLYDDLTQRAVQVVAAFQKTDSDLARPACQPDCRGAALAAMVAGDSQTAIAYLQAQAAETPADKSVYLLLGEALARSQNYEQALAAWRQAGADEAFSRSATFSIKNELQVRDHYFQLASDINPKNAQIYLNWMGLYAEQRAYREVLRVFDLAVTREVAEAALDYQAGLAYRESGDPDKAQQQFEAAIKLDSSDGRAYQRLADLYFNEKDDPTGGFQILERYRLAIPNAPEPSYQIGLRYYERGNYQDALLSLQQAAERGMTSADLDERIGISQYQMSLFAPAARTLETAIAKQDQELGRGLDIPAWRRYNVRAYLALALEAQGDTTRARNYACQAVKFEQKHPGGAPQLLPILLDSCY